MSVEDLEHEMWIESFLMAMAVAPVGEDLDTQEVILGMVDNGWTSEQADFIMSAAVKRGLAAYVGPNVELTPAGREVAGKISKMFETDSN